MVLVSPTAKPRQEIQISPHPPQFLAMALSRLPVPLTVGRKGFSLLHFPMKPMAEKVSLKDFIGRWQWLGSKLFGAHSTVAGVQVSSSLDA